MNINDLMDVVQWVIEQQTDRPTVPSSDSSPGSDGTATGTPSTAQSPSPVVIPLVTSTSGGS
jgi:hypothetical protein